MHNSVRSLNLIVSYNNFGSRLQPIFSSFNPDDVVFSSDIPKEIIDRQVDGNLGMERFSNKVIVLMASPIECYIADVAGQLGGTNRLGSVTREELDDLQTRVKSKSGSGSFYQWWVRNFVLPFGINRIQDPFPRDGFLNFMVAGYEIIFVRLQDDLSKVAEIIGEKTGLPIHRQVEKRSNDGDRLSGFKLEDMLCFPYSFLRSSFSPGASEPLEITDPSNKQILKYCDYDQDYPVESVVNNQGSIQQTFPNYVRKELYFQKLWFVDIPRTSSSSIKIELQKHYGAIFGKNNLLDHSYVSRQILPDHIPARIMRKQLGADQWKRLFTFTFIRNPWERMVSLYLYRKDKVKNIPDDLSFTDYIVRLQCERGRGLFKYHGFYYGNSDYLLDENGELLIDFIGRYENRNNDLIVIAGRLGISGLGDIRTQISRDTEIHYSTYYNQETREIVENLYKDDIKLFGYKFQNNG